MSDKTESRILSTSMFHMCITLFRMAKASDSVQDPLGYTQSIPQPRRRLDCYKSSRHKKQTPS